METQLTTIPGESKPQVGTGDRAWRRKMARFELSKARRLRDEGNHARAAIALLRAKIWRCDPLRTLPESRLMVDGAWKPN